MIDWVWPEVSRVRRKSTVQGSHAAAAPAPRITASVQKNRSGE